MTVSELIYINGVLMNNPQIVTGKRKVRDIDLLDAAAQRPQASAFGTDAYPTLALKAAALMHSLMRNHPFADGNKRTATVAALMMFAVNGARVVWDQPAALEKILAAAEGRVDLDALAAWFPVAGDDGITHAPDEDTDKALVAQIIDEQRWLLHELETR